MSRTFTQSEVKGLLQDVFSSLSESLNGVLVEIERARDGDADPFDDGAKLAIEHIRNLFDTILRITVEQFAEPTDPEMPWVQTRD